MKIPWAGSIPVVQKFCLLPRLKSHDLVSWTNKIITINYKKSPLILQRGRLQGLLHDQNSFKSKNPCSWSSGAPLLFLVFHTPCMLTKPSLCVFPDSLTMSVQLQCTIKLQHIKS